MCVNIVSVKQSYFPGCPARPLPFQLGSVAAEAVAAPAPAAATPARRLPVVRRARGAARAAWSTPPVDPKPRAWRAAAKLAGVFLGVVGGDECGC